MPECLAPRGCVGEAERDFSPGAEISHDGFQSLGYQDSSIEFPPDWVDPTGYPDPTGYWVGRVVENRSKTRLGRVEISRTQPNPTHLDPTRRWVKIRLIDM